MRDVEVRVRPVLRRGGVESLTAKPGVPDRTQFL